LIYLSHLLNKTIIDSRENKIGTLEDLIILDGEKSAEVVAIVCKNRDGLFRIPINLVEVIEHIIKLSVSRERALNFGTVQPDDLHLKSAILDKQLIDTDGLKVIRVNDVALSTVGGKFCVIGVDSGVRGLMRRLGINDSISKALLKSKNSVPNIISWEFVAPLEPDSKHLRLKIERKSINSMHPADLAELMEDLSKEERVLVMKSLDTNMAADALAEAEPHIQKGLVEDMKIKRVTSILDKMTADEIADLLALTNDSKREEILSIMKPEIAKQVKEIMKYPEDTAGALMSTEFISIPWHMTAEQAINKIRELAPSHSKIYYLYVVNEKGELEGVLSLRQLIVVQPNKRVCDFMNTQIAKVDVSTPKQHIAMLFSKYSLLALPVVDEHGILKGIVTAHDIIENVMPESWAKGRVKRNRTKKPTREASDNSGQANKKEK